MDTNLNTDSRGKGIAMCPNKTELLLILQAWRAQALNVLDIEKVNMINRQIDTLISGD